MTTPLEPSFQKSEPTEPLLEDPTVQDLHLSSGGRGRRRRSGTRSVNLVTPRVRAGNASHSRRSSHSSCPSVTQPEESLFFESVALLPKSDVPEFQGARTAETKRGIFYTYVTDGGSEGAAPDKNHGDAVRTVPRQPLFRVEVPSYVPNRDKAIPAKMLLDLQHMMSSFGCRGLDCPVAVEQTNDGNLLLSTAFHADFVPVAHWTPNSQDEVFLMLRDVSRVLRYTRSRGMHHCHLHANNILVSRTATVADEGDVATLSFVVTGFGWEALFCSFSANDLWDLGYHDAAMFSPELVRESARNGCNGRLSEGEREAADLWAVGCVAFSILFGGKLYESEVDDMPLARDELFDMIRSDTPVPFPWRTAIRLKNTDAADIESPPDAELVRIIRRLLAKSPLNRGTAEDLQRAATRRARKSLTGTAALRRKTTAMRSNAASESSFVCGEDWKPLAVPGSLALSTMVSAASLIQLASSHDAAVPPELFASILLTSHHDSHLRSPQRKLTTAVRCSVCGVECDIFFLCKTCKEADSPSAAAATEFRVCTDCMREDAFQHSREHTFVQHIVEVVTMNFSESPSMPFLAVQDSGIAPERRTSSATSFPRLESVSVIQTTGDPAGPLGSSVPRPSSASRLSVPGRGTDDLENSSFSAASTMGPRGSVRTFQQTRVIPASLLSSRERSIVEMSGTLPSGMLDHERRMLTQSTLGAVRGSSVRTGSGPQSLLASVIASAPATAMDAVSPTTALLSSPARRASDAELTELIDACVAERAFTLLLNDLGLAVFPTAVLKPTPLEHVTVLDLANNQIAFLPAEIEVLVNLRQLLLGNNRLLSIPAEVGNLTDLQVLDLNRNEISTLPQSLMFCDELQTLSLDYNAFVEFPVVVFDLPSLETVYLMHNLITHWPAADVLNEERERVLVVAVDNDPALVATAPASFTAQLKIEWNKVYPDPILPGSLYLGSLRTAQDDAVYRKLNIQYVLTMGRGLDALPPPGGKHKVVVVDDLPGASIDFAFEEAVEFIDEAARAGLGCLVHCFAGMSRSATTVIAYLMMKRGMRLDEAYCTARRGRPAIYPNAGFFDQLIALDAKLFPGQRALDMPSMERDKVP